MPGVRKGDDSLKLSWLEIVVSFKIYRAIVVYSLSAANFFKSSRVTVFKAFSLVAFKKILQHH